MFRKAISRAGAIIPFSYKGVLENYKLTRKLSLSSRKPKFQPLIFSQKKSLIEQHLLISLQNFPIHEESRESFRKIHD